MPKQQDFHALGATKRERMMMAANRVGKSDAGAYEIALHLTGDYPSTWKGKRFDHPTSGWVAGVSSLATRDVIQDKLCGKPGVKAEYGHGFIPLDRMADTPSMARGVTDAFDTIQVKHSTDGIEDGVSTCSFKSFEQGREKFQGATLDFGWCDEEPEDKLYSEFLTRIIGSGIMLITFTPLLGRSALVTRLMQASPDRAVVQMTLDEALQWSAHEKEKMLLGYAEHEREARSQGIPLLGEGRVFPQPADMWKEPPIDFIPQHWVKLWGIDFGIAHPFAAVLILWDKDNDCIHVHHAFKMSDGLPINHASAMKPIGAAVPVAWPQDGTQREKTSGEPISRAYAREGLIMLPNHATFEDGSLSTEAAVLEISQRISTGKIKAAAHLSSLWEEYGTYHRKDGLIVKEYDDIMSALQKAVMMKRFARLVPLGGRKSPNNSGGTYKPFDPFTGEPF